MESISVPIGTYYFNTVVNLAGFDPATAQLVGVKYATDNKLIAIEVNDVVAYSQPIGYAEDFRAFNGLPTIRGRVIFPDGTEQPLDMEKSWDVPAVDSSMMYLDNRLLNVGVPVIPAGGVLEYEIVRTVLDLTPFLFPYDTY